MNPSVARSALDAGLDCGADFAELFVEETRESNLLLKESKIDSAEAATAFGVGVRLIFGSEVLYAYTSDDSEESLVALARKLGSLRAAARKISTDAPFVLKPAARLREVLLDPRGAGQRAKLPMLQTLDRVARGAGARIAQVSASMSDAVSEIEIYNSEGLAVSDRRTRTRLALNVVAGEGDEKVSARHAPGSTLGFEFFKGLDLDLIARTTAEQALRMLGAGYVEGGKMPVVIGNGFGGVIFHEACGHPLETESVRKNASAFGGKLGEKIAHSCLTAVDDGTLPGVWGSIAVDDEGTPTQRTVLIENGVLKTFLSDRVGAAEVGVPRSGSARRESYELAPVARMRNTFIAPGTSSLSEMLASAGEGLYACKMGGGSVNPATGEFNFAVEEGYRIRGGKLAEPVRGASLIGKGPEVLPLISMVGDDLELASGICGASSGLVPVTVGQPTIKVDSILVGGR
ncbi:MAG: TldD/PmbA family protein [Fibrobacterales bacterium]|nr:TldD/PmbA family protein [Fibrobacterales bacterium]